MVERVRILRPPEATEEAPVLEHRDFPNLLKLYSILFVRYSIFFVRNSNLFDQMMYEFDRFFKDLLKLFFDLILSRNSNLYCQYSIKQCPNSIFSSPPNLTESVKAFFDLIQSENDSFDNESGITRLDFFRSQEWICFELNCPTIDVYLL